MSAAFMVLVATLAYAIPEPPRAGLLQPSQSGEVRLQGTWLATFGKFNGTRWSPANVLEFKLRIDGTRYRITSGKRTEEGRYRMVPGGLDFLPATGPLAGSTIRAIFHLDEDRLMLCLSPPGTDRPRGFSAEAGTDHIWIIFRPEVP